MHVVAAVDHFGPETPAVDVARAVSIGAQLAGWTCRQAPMSDGGPGLLSAVGRQNRRTLVMGPLGDPVEVPWILMARTAIIEAALASGLPLLTDGVNGNDPIAAGTHGVGELILAAVEAGAKRVVVGVGGTASTDGGLGAIRAVFAPTRLKGVRLIVAYDAVSLFRDAADASPAKGASTAQMKLLRRRLERLVQVYRDQYGVDVSEAEGAGAGGGLAGGLLALGGELRAGAEVVADEVDVASHIETADLVITGETFLDAHSLSHGVVGTVRALADLAGVPCCALATASFDQVDDHMPVLRVDGKAVLASIAESVYAYLSDYKIQTAESKPNQPG